MYIETMRRAGFDSEVGLYVASGLLTYGDSQGRHSLFLAV